MINSGANRLINEINKHMENIAKPSEKTNIALKIYCKEDFCTHISADILLKEKLRESLI